MALYLSKHTNSRIKLFPVTLSSNEDLLPAYRSLQDQKIHLIIIGATSSSLANLLQDIDSNEDLIFNIMSASEDFTSKDDNIIRNIPDTVLESRSIADFIARKFPGKELLVIFDTFNSVYCASALKSLTNYLSQNYPSLKYDNRRSVVLGYFAGGYPRMLSGQTIRGDLRFERRRDGIPGRFVHPGDQDPQQGGRFRRQSVGKRENVLQVGRRRTERYLYSFDRTDAFRLRKLFEHRHGV